MTRKTYTQCKCKACGKPNYWKLVCHSTKEKSHQRKKQTHGPNKDRSKPSQHLPVHNMTEESCTTLNILQLYLHSLAINSLYADSTVYTWYAKLILVQKEMLFLSVSTRSYAAIHLATQVEHPSVLPHQPPLSLPLVETRYNTMGHAPLTLHIVAN